ncbi:hypothetical protein [Legionella cardiaca]|uniref:Uncharacterized protein n=1 Tax=Legionella cardiaca TaxID=1071983 RepID=A0ABY8ATF2_9GAMM|nr:hypothetical protein [Legionella cardiaca]WED43950.1 hypothetical protein PXX05_03970 [Legionella cardiaca]
MKQSLEEIIKSPFAKERFRLAQEAFEHTMSVIKGSSNRLSESEIQTSFGQKIITSLNKMREEKIEEPLYSLEWIQHVAFLAEAYGVGNCCEKGCVTFNVLHRLLDLLPSGRGINIELFNNPMIDHFFVVIGRDSSTDSANPCTWNKEAIICDPWVGKTLLFSW